MTEQQLQARPNRQVVDDLDAFINVLPQRVRDRLHEREDVNQLVEVILDLGRPAEARFPAGQELLGEEDVTHEDIQHVVQRVGHFGDDNRAGIERTLHRISVMRNRAGDPVGLTCRVGRAVFGSVRLIEDLVGTGESILLLGRPGVGKTTMLREVARVLADDAGKRVVVVDTSNEIAGDGDVPHPAIGRARRLQVPHTELQHQVMIEAVENHMPEVVIIDEMSTELEAMAARTISERGVQLIATAHGNTLANVISNPSLADLAGGTQTVTLGDIEARRRRTQKTVLERKHDPTFSIIVEIRERNSVSMHRDVGSVVDRMLRGIPVAQEVRWLDDDGDVRTEIEEHLNAEPEFRTAAFDVNPIRPSNGSGDWPGSQQPGRVERRPVAQAAPAASAVAPPSAAAEVQGPPVKVHPFGVPKPALVEAIDQLKVPVEVVEFADEADIFVTTKSHYNRRPSAVRRAEREGVPVYVLRRGTDDQIALFLRRFGAAESNGRSGDGAGENGHVRDALEEVETAINRVMSGERKVELSPQASFIRRLQHGLAGKHNVGSSSTGREPGRRVVIRRRRR
ncbi:MAG: R3H domain-containing nucleic acid-binding protein [Dehalococcoidia bacterium]